MTKKYRARAHTWFKEGTIVELIDDYRPKMNCGLFSGVHVYSLGEHVDEEICSFDEFEQQEENERFKNRQS